MKRTLILGATTNQDRYAYLAANKLKAHGHDIINIGIKTGELAGKNIEKAGEIYPDVDTITLYVGVKHQPEYYDYILKTNPKRIIFNPGTENPELEDLASQHRIETLHACTLVLLSIGKY